MKKVTLHMRPGSPYWVAAFDVPQPDGSIRRLKKSTKKTEYDDAMEVALQFSGLEKKIALATDDDDRANLDLLAKAQKAAARGELNEAKVMELMSDMLKNATGDGLREYTVRSWSDEWLRRKLVLKVSTQNRYRTSVKAFLKFLGDDADKSINRLTKTNMRDFQEVVRYGKQLPENKQNREGARVRLPEAVRTAKTTNQYLDDIRAMLEEAFNDEILSRNPANSIKSLDETDSASKEPYSIEEVRTLVAKSGETGWYSLIFSPKTNKPRLRLDRSADWPGVIMFGYYIGGRIGDISRLIWSKINLEDEIIKFVPEKTEKHLKVYEVPIHPSLVKWLKRHKGKHSNNDPIFPTLSKTSVSGTAGLSQQFAAIMDYSKVDRMLIRPATKTRKAQYARGFHSLRHTSNSDLANAKVSKELRMKIIGHQSEEVNMRYTHHQIKVLRDEILKLGEI